MRHKSSPHAHYGEYTYEEIAEKLNLSKEAVRQIEMRALRKLSHPSISKKLREAFETLILLNREEIAI